MFDQLKLSPLTKVLQHDNSVTVETVFQWGIIRAVGTRRDLVEMGKEA